MRTERKIVGLGILAGLAYWGLDALLGYAGAEGAFVDHLVGLASPRAILMRLVAFAVCVALAVAAALCFRGRRRAISRLRRAEDRVAESQSLLDVVLGACSDGISVTMRDPKTPTRRLVTCNDRYVEMSGRTREELMAADDLRHFYTMLRRPPDIERLERDGLPQWGVSSWNRPDGAENYYEWTASPLQRDGKTYYLCVDRDITERMRAERELRAERDRVWHYMNVAKVIFVALDTDGVVTMINKMGCEVLGCTEDELLGVNWYQTFIPSDRRAEAAERFRQILAGQIESGARKEGAILTASGEERMIAWHNSLTYDERDKLTGMLSSGLDITEQIRTEQQFRQAQKMEAIGRLAGGIAHDFNNQLTVIQGYCEMLLGRLRVTDMIGECVGQIKGAADRAAQLTGQLLAYSRRQVLRNEIVAVNSLLGDLLDPLARIIGEDIRLSVDLDEAAGNVRTDPVQLQQVLMNMAVNARDAMPDGGTLTLGTRCVPPDDPVLRRHQADGPGDFVMLRVCDTGVGMPDQVRQRVFEPFFTTKPTGEGTGLGLAMAYGFVRQSAGFIEVESEPGRGASFKVYLPRAERSAGDSGIPAPLEDVVEGTGTLLVAEDEPSVRVLITQVLRRCGYTVLACADADEAIATAERHDGPIDMLVTDVIMPGRSGPELAAAIRRGQPDLKLLYISGYTEDVAGRTGGGGLDGLLLPKPFGPEKLAAAVHEAFVGVGREDG